MAQIPSMAFSFSNIVSSLSGGTRIPKRSLGIDIGSSSIKIVEVENTSRALVLKTYGELQLGPYSEQMLGETVKLSQEKQTQALVDVVRESHAEAKDGVFAIPLTSSFVTVVPISIREGEKLEGKVSIEARKYIPVPLQDVILDWSQLNEYGDKEVTVYEILLAAIQRDAYDQVQGILESMQMVSQPAEIEVFSCIRSLYQNDVETTAIIDVGAETNKLYITRNGALERIHRVYAGGAACTKRLAQLINVSFEAAEDIKRANTENAEHHADVRKAYISSVDRSVQEFKRVIEQYEARIGNSIERVVLTGGAASFSEAQSIFSDMLSREVLMANPFSLVAYPAFLEDTLADIGPSFSVALGAAMRPYN